MKNTVGKKAVQQKSSGNAERTGENTVKINNWDGSQEGLMRIIQESVPGKQITMAHIIASPDPVIYQKLGLDPRVDYQRSAIGVLTLSPSETAIIAADLAIKAAAIEIGFIDRFSGTLIITGTISDVNIAFETILQYVESHLGFAVCGITKA